MMPLSASVPPFVLFGNFPIGDMEFDSDLDRLLPEVYDIDITVIFDALGRRLRLEPAPRYETACAGVEPAASSVEELSGLLLGHADGTGFDVPPEHRDGSHAAIRWLRVAQQHDQLVEWTPVRERVAAWVRQLRGV